MCRKQDFRIITASGCLFLAVLASCSFPATEVRRGRPPTPTTSTASSSCDQLAASQRIADLFEDVSEGRLSGIEQHFADDDMFQWYSVTEGNPRKGGRHRAIYSVNDLEDYFRGRYRHQEQLALLKLRTYQDSAGSLIHFSMLLKRSADDLAPTGVTTNVATGKGAIECPSTRIVAMSIGMGDDSSRDIDICPDDATKVGDYTLCTS